MLGLRGRSLRQQVRTKVGSRRVSKLARKEVRREGSYATSASKYISVFVTMQVCKYVNVEGGVTRRQRGSK